MLVTPPSKKLSRQLLHGNGDGVARHAVNDDLDVLGARRNTPWHLHVHLVEPHKSRGQAGKGHLRGYAADVHQQCTKRSRQWLSGGGNLARLDFGLYRTEPRAKD